MAEGSGVRRQPGREWRDCCPCPEHQSVCSRPKDVALLQAALSALGVLPGAGSGAAAPHDVHLQWGWSQWLSSPLPRGVNHGINVKWKTKELVMFSSTAGLWECSLSSRRAESRVLLLQTAPHCSGEHRCGAGSPQCLQLPNTSCITGMSFPSAMLLQAQLKLCHLLLAQI